MSTTTSSSWWQRPLLAVARWFDTEAGTSTGAPPKRDDNFVRLLPYLALHLTCLGVIWVGVSPVAVAVAAAFFLFRMFVVTAFYHRYFSHKAFKLNRFWQAVAAVLGCMCVQRGPLWWAAHHRHHHRHSDEPEDTHSPVQSGFWYSHVGWILDPKNSHAHYNRVPDLYKYPELRFIDRACVLVAIGCAVGMYYLGVLLSNVAPELGTSGAQMLIWGFFISTIVLHHSTFTINSLSHVWGKRKYETTDDSRNNWMLAILTFGEGWHNNHHHYQASARQGFRWYEWDLTYYILTVLSWMRIVKDMKKVPERVKQRTAEVVRAEREAAAAAAAVLPEPALVGSRDSEGFGA